MAVDEETGRATYAVSQMALSPARELARQKGWEALYTDRVKSLIREPEGAPPADLLLRDLLETQPQRIQGMLDDEKRDLLERVKRATKRSPGYEVELLQLEAEAHRQLGNLTTADEKYQEAVEKLIQNPQKAKRERFQALLLEAATVAKQAGATEARLRRAVGYLERIKDHQAGALRVFGMLAEFTGLLGDKHKFDEYSENVRSLIERSGLKPDQPQRHQAEAAVERGKDGLTKQRAK